VIVALEASQQATIRGVSEKAVAGFDEKLRPVLARKPLASGKQLRRSLASLLYQLQEESCSPKAVTSASRVGAQSETPSIS
jgi:hypothetical protein